MPDFNFMTGQTGNPYAAMMQQDAPQFQAMQGVGQQGPSQPFYNGLAQQDAPQWAAMQGSPVTQGLDWAKLGQWATNKGAQGQSGGYQQAIAQLQPGRAGGPLGQVNQQSAGYVGPGQLPQVLPVGSFLRKR